MRILLISLLMASAVCAQISSATYTDTNNVYMVATLVSSMQTAAPGITVTAGALLVACGRISGSTGGTAGNITAVSDGGSNSFTAAGATLSHNGALIRCFYKLNASGGSNLQFTFTFDGTSNYAAGLVAHYTGIITSSALDQYLTATAIASATTVTTASFSTAQANELVFAFGDIGATGTTWTATSPLTLRSQSDSNVIMFADEIAASQLSSVTRQIGNADTTGTKSLIVMTFKGEASSAARRRIVN